MQENEDKKFVLLSILCPPLYFTLQTIRKIKNRSEEATFESEVINLKTHRAKFCECLLESFPQLCLSFHIIHHHGLDKSFVTKTIQIASITGSLISLITNFSVRYAYLKYRKSPTIYQKLKSALLNCIPSMTFIFNMFIVMSMNSYFLKTFLIIGLFVLFPMFYPLIVLLIFAFVSCVCYPFSNDFSRKIEANLGKDNPYVRKYLYPEWLSINRVLFFSNFIVSLLFTMQTILRGSKNATLACLQKPFLQALSHNFPNINETMQSIPTKSFNICSTIDINKSLNFGELNFVDKNPDIFMYIVWGLLCLGIIHLILEKIWLSWNFIENSENLHKNFVDFITIGIFTDDLVILPANINNISVSPRSPYKENTKFFAQPSEGSQNNFGGGFFSEREMSKNDKGNKRKSSNIPKILNFDLE